MDARAPAGGVALEAALAALLYGAAAPPLPALAALDADEVAAAARELRRMVLGRTHRGSGGVREWYAGTVAAWRAQHPDDRDLDLLATRFCASAACAAWREAAGAAPGLSLEEAFLRFFEAAGVGDALTREEEAASAVVRALAVAPRARFRWPAWLRRAPGGCYAVTRAGVLHAAVDGRYLRGPLTPLVAALLRGDAPEAAAVACAAPLADVDAVRRSLVAMRLL